MKTFDVQAVALNAPFHDVFHYIADPRNLPQWTHAFQSADHEQARMATPQGAVHVRLETAADSERGTIDWTVTFPDGSIARAFSRVVPNADRCVYSFVLTPPPVPLEQLEGALENQSAILREELARLREILEQGRRSSQ